MEFIDYYKILGVAEDASSDQIKRAYRKLARKYHPDVSQETDAEARFKEVGEAYDVLKDAEKRSAYDELRLQPHGSAASRHRRAGTTSSRVPATAPSAISSMRSSMRIKVRVRFGRAHTPHPPGTSINGSPLPSKRRSTGTARKSKSAQPTAPVPGA